MMTTVGFCFIKIKYFWIIILLFKLMNISLLDIKIFYKISLNFRDYFALDLILKK